MLKLWADFHHSGRNRCVGCAFRAHQSALSKREPRQHLPTALTLVARKRFRDRCSYKTVEAHMKARIREGSFARPHLYMGASASIKFRHFLRK